MKKTIFSVMLLCCSTIGYSQLLEVTSTEKVNLPEGVKADKVTLSPTGDFCLVADQMQQGLQTFDFATGKITTVSTAAGSDYNARVVGNTIVFRTNVMQNRLKYTTLNVYDIATGTTTNLVSATRDLKGYAAQGNTIRYIKGNKVETIACNNGIADKNLPVAFIEYGKLMISIDGKITNISPNGTSGQSYLWPSVSPDGTKVAYYLATKGAYVCNIDGSNPVSLGMMRAPKWCGNDIVIGMRDHDNGYFITSSDIIATSIDGKQQQVLTDESVIAIYPSANEEGNKIAYTTTSGEAYIINVIKK